MSESTPKETKEIRWQPHKHCPVCGNAMPTTKEYCSEECEKFYSDFKEQQQKKNRRLYLLILPLSAVVILFILLQFGF